MLILFIERAEWSPNGLLVRISDDWKVIEYLNEIREQRSTLAKRWTVNVKIEGFSV